jgi:hypothetical protein
MASRSDMSGTAIGVLLRACLDQADYKMLVGMSREPVLDVMSMNDLDIIRMPEPVNANPLRICSHREQFFDERTAISTILQHVSLMTGNQK